MFIIVQRCKPAIKPDPPKQGRSCRVDRLFAFMTSLFGSLLPLRVAVALITRLFTSLLPLRAAAAVITRLFVFLLPLRAAVAVITRLFASLLPLRAASPPYCHYGRPRRFSPSSLSF